MRNLLPLLVLAPLGLATAQAAISVGVNGTPVISFGSRPPVEEWSTRSIAGSELSFTAAGTLNAAVQTNAAAGIATPLIDGLGSLPPGQSGLASWTSGGSAALWTRPAANAATLLLATLQNDTGADQPSLRISYTLGESAGTPSEQAPAHEVFYSFSGAPGTWVHIPALSGGGAGFKSNIVSLAQAWGRGAPLHVLWADDNAVGGVDRGYSLDNIFFSGKPTPILPLLSNRVVDVLQLVRFPVGASSVLPGSALAFSLDAGAPSAARIDPVNGLFLWAPSRADAGTTNQITVRVTDPALPVTTATNTFSVVVKDYVELSLGSVLLLAGNLTNVILESVATVPLTNLAVTVRFPAARLANVVVSNLVSAQAALTIDAAQPGEIRLNFAAEPGQEFLGTQRLASVEFVAAGEGSAFLPLELVNASVARSLLGPAPRLLLNPARAAIVGVEPLLEARDTNATRTLTLYGHPGASYGLEFTTNLSGPWQLLGSGALSLRETAFEVNGHAGLPMVLYRAHYLLGDPPTLAAPLLKAAAPPAARKSLQVIQAKKKKIAALKAAQRKIRNARRSAANLSPRPGD